MLNRLTSRGAQRRLLMVVAAAAVLIIFAYGWSVTDINLNRPQEPLRQQNVGNALRELLSPNIFQQDYTIINATTPILMDCPADGSAPAPAEPTGGDEPHVVVTPACARSGELVTVQGYNFYPDSLARINWIAADGERRIRQVVGTSNDNFVTNPDGTFTVEIEVPRIRGTSGQTHTVEAQGRFPAGLPRFSDTTGLVLEKMIETIFLALIATSLSILPSAILSFFAAHNLMRPVRMSLGNLLVGFALLPVGWLLGTEVLGRIGTLAVNVGKGAGFSLDAVGALSSLFLFAAVTSSRAQASSISLNSDHLREIASKLLLAVVVVAAIGLLGGLGILFGGLFTEGLPRYLSNFIGSLGQLVELAILPIAGITGAFTVSSAGMSLALNGLKKLHGAPAHLLGGALGAICGAILMGMVASIGMQAAWLGLLPPVAAASLASGILPALYRRFVPQPARPTATSRSIQTALSWVGIIVALVGTAAVLNVDRAVIAGTLPSTRSSVSLPGLTLYPYVTQAMLIGAVLGSLSAALAGTKATFPLGEILYNTTRTILNALRSIEPLIMGLVFVIWVGIGPFAGVLALTLHSIASLGKLYSEQIENIDSGPIEALQSTGANRLQTIMYAVVPQIIPPYIAFTMYRWDINVRMSTIIGFVGGGGVGFLLQQQINLLRYRDAGVAVLAIAIVVSVLDYASASIRERVM